MKEDFAGSSGGPSQRPRMGFPERLVGGAEILIPGN
jgi:hypothetical protein